MHFTFTHCNISGTIENYKIKERKTMYIDFEQIEKLTGLHFENIEQLYFYILNQIEYLKVHNKNYTKKQYYIIDDFLSIIHSVKWEE